MYPRKYCEQKTTVNIIICFLTSMFLCNITKTEISKFSELLFHIRNLLNLFLLNKVNSTCRKTLHFARRCTCTAMKVPLNWKSCKREGRDNIMPKNCEREERLFPPKYLSKFLVFVVVLLARQETRPISQNNECAAETLCARFYELEPTFAQILRRRSIVANKDYVARSWGNAINWKFCEMIQDS